MRVGQQKVTRARRQSNAKRPLVHVCDVKNSLIQRICFGTCTRDATIFNNDSIWDDKGKSGEYKAGAALESKGDPLTSFFITKAPTKIRPMQAMRTSVATTRTGLNIYSAGRPGQQESKILVFDSSAYARTHLLKLAAELHEERADGNRRASSSQHSPRGHRNHAGLGKGRTHADEESSSY